MKLQQMLDVLCRLAPEALAEPWDKVGLHVGDRNQSVRRLLLCIDLTAEVLQEAGSGKCELIVAYHSPIFTPLPALTANDPRQRIILHAIQRGIALYSPHTALDAAPGGINDWLCAGLGSGTINPIKPLVSSPERPLAQVCKLVVFVPPGHVDALRAALAAAGAGGIGDYSQCSFNLVGQGTFRGGASTNPTIGKRGRLEHVQEIRLEMICPLKTLDKAIAALRSAHPYEEPAFDVYPLLPVPAPRQGDEAQAGQGRILTLDQPVNRATLVRRGKKRLRLRQIEVAVGAGKKKTPVRRIGVCAGAGGALLEVAGDVDVFLTGEMRHHDIVAAQARGITVVLAGHTQTERPYLPTYRRRILAELGKQAREVDCRISHVDRPPTTLF